MVKLYDKDTGQKLGEITEEQLELLMDELEDEPFGDQDYHIDEAAIALFEEIGADPDLVDTLRSMLAGQDEFEIRWSQD